VREIQNIHYISLTLHYTYYLFYCVTNKKYTIPFLTLFILQIIYSIVWQIQKHTNIVLYRDKYPTGNGCDILFMVIHRNHLFPLYYLLWKARETSHEFAKNCYPLEMIEGRKAYPPSEDTTWNTKGFHIYNYCGTIMGRFSHILWEKCKIYKYWIPFLSLFIIHIISIVWQIKNIQILDTISLTLHYT
jgi:hypothetical protein